MPGSDLLLLLGEGAGGWEGKVRGCHEQLVSNEKKGHKSNCCLGDFLGMKNYTLGFHHH